MHANIEPFDLIENGEPVISLGWMISAHGYYEYVIYGLEPTGHQHALEADLVLDQFIAVGNHITITPAFFAPFPRAGAGSVPVPLFPPTAHEMPLLA